MLSLKRLQTLLKKLGSDPDLFNEYQSILEKYVKEGIIEEVKDAGLVGKVHYLPHRAVVRRDRETTKVRIVFDGSAKEKGGKSLNELLHPGPCLLAEIFGVLIRFCFGKIGVVADVRQAFLSVEIHEEDKK